VDEDGNIVLKNERTVRRQVISEESSEKLRKCLENVVESSPDHNVAITGYSIGGKSGTSQRISMTGNSNYGSGEGENDDEMEYGASYCCFTPADDPEIILLVLADMPSKKNDNYYGSRVAVPTAKDIFVEVLPKLGISPEYSEEELKNLDVKVPLLEGHIDDAKATLDNLGLKYEVIGNGIEVVSQSPLTGSMVSKDGCVYLYTEKRSDLVKYVEVPSFEFMDLENANLQASWSGLNIVTSGVSPTRPGAYVSGQKIEVGTRVVQGTVIELEFSMSESSYTAFAD